MNDTETTDRDDDQRADEVADALVTDETAADPAVESLDDTQSPENEIPSDDAADDSEEPERVYTKDELSAARAENQDRYLRLLAEYDNFRRRTSREKAVWSADAVDSFVKGLLPVFDSIDKAHETETDDAAAMREGLEVTYRQLRAALESQNVEIIDPVGEPFDPQYHEALMRTPSADHAAGTVISVFERGYKVGPRLIRAARCVVAAES